jgi:hypothetical protein
MPLVRIRGMRGFRAGGAVEPPAVWGPREWRKNHVAAIRYPEIPTKDDERREFMALWERAQNLPCSDCRGHAAAYMRRFPPDLSGSRGYQIWAVRFHNAVNVRKGKPLFTWAQYLRLYARDIHEAQAALKPQLDV